MTIDVIAKHSQTIAWLFFGNLEYILLITSMMMTRMLLLRIFAIGSGVAGGCYSYLWLGDPMGTVWEIIFTVVNVGQIALIHLRNMSTRFNDEERAFYAQVVPTLDPHQARRLMQTGAWLDGEPGRE